MQNPCKPHEGLWSGANGDVQNTQINNHWSLFSGCFRKQRHDRWLFPQPPGSDDRFAPPTGGADQSHALARNISIPCAAVGASGQGWQEDRWLGLIWPGLGRCCWRRLQCWPASSAHPFDGGAAVPQACVQRERLRRDSALGRDTDLAIICWQRVFWATMAVRPHTTGALAWSFGRRRRGRAARPHHGGGDHGPFVVPVASERFDVIAGEIGRNLRPQTTAKVRSKLGAGSRWILQVFLITKFFYSHY